MELTGLHFIAGESSASGDNSFVAQNPATGEQLEPRFVEALSAEVDQCLRKADEAFDQLQQLGVEKLAGFLNAIGSQLEAHAEAICQRAGLETGLPAQRLQMELARTVGHCRMFAGMVRDGGWVQARIDRSDPNRQPLPKPDLRSMLMAVGPVVVFGASNFPLAISVAGTDTISALAARCPVVVKAHPAHPGTCELVAAIISETVKESGLPAGTFSMLHGAGHEVGEALVAHPLTAAVAFTGSLRGGRALYDVAVRRPNPIPFYGELGSSNPVFLLPGAIQERASQMAAAYIQSVTLGAGQFCTNPGLVFCHAGEPFQQFAAEVMKAVGGVRAATMLHAGIHQSYSQGTQRIAATQGVEPLAIAEGSDAEKQCQAQCMIFAADADILQREPYLADEVFGPESIVLRCREKSDMLEFARRMDCNLTATIHGTEEDLLEHADLVRLLRRKVGRIIFNGFPTGLEVCSAMHHGGPYPATTHGNFTSVGQFAIFRFVRPICFQGFPEAALPVELQDANPRAIPRLVGGKLEVS